MEKKHVVYIMTNPAFSNPSYVKIGYADDVEQRRKELSNTSVPFPYRVYATLKVNTRLADKKIHNLIDFINPGLRVKSIDTDGKEYVREFYAMTPEDAYDILSMLITIINAIGSDNQVEKWELTSSEKKNEASVKRQKNTRFSFDMCNITAGEKIQFIEDPTLDITVINNRMVSYNGEEYYLSNLASVLSTSNQVSYQGPLYFTYKGERLTDLRARLEK